MTDDLRTLARVVQRMSGIALRDGQLGSLRAALRRIDPQLEPAELLGESDPLRRGPLLDRLVDEVTVNETFFLRHAEELDAIEWPAMAARAAAAGRGAVRVWSAACSSGEEPYSLALLAAEALGSARSPVDILGTDISGTALGRARRAVYNARSVRLVSPARRERWFAPIGGGLSVGADLRAVVRFERHNLVRDPIPPGGEAPFDLIVCRNVLIYFDAPTVTRIRAALSEALMPGGRLLLGTVDRLGTTPSPPRERTPAVRSPRHPRPERRARARRAPSPRERAAPGTGRAPDANAEAALEAGMRALGDGDVPGAVQALRRALYLEPSLAVAALQLGRAHEALGDVAGARRSYWRALRLAEEADDPATRLYDRVGAADVAAACRARLTVLPGG
jgi:chemotaxis protein methyltransferase CheR